VVELNKIITVRDLPIGLYYVVYAEGKCTPSRGQNRHYCLFSRVLI